MNTHEKLKKKIRKGMTETQLKTPRKEIVKFLQKQGWNIVLVGRIYCEQANHLQKYNVKFIMEFVGNKSEIKKLEGKK